MNRFKAVIEEVESEGSMSLVSLKIGDQKFSSIVLDKPDSADYLVAGNEVQIMFKETEVVIDKNTTHSISLRNRIKGEILKIERNRLLSKLEIKSNIGQLISIITTGSVNRLNLKEGDVVFAMIKTNEIFLSK